MISTPATFRGQATVEPGSFADEAWWNVYSDASARIGIATANFFPRFRLTALLGRVSPELSSLSGGTADIWALASSFSGPVFTGGRLTNERRAAVDVFDQTKYQYSQSALRAFREVSDALLALQKLSAVEEQQKHEVAALTDSVSIARRRYLGGLASYYEVLEAQQLLYSAEISLPRLQETGGLPSFNSIARWAAAGVSITHGGRMGSSGESNQNASGDLPSNSDTAGRNRLRARSSSPHHRRSRRKQKIWRDWSIHAQRLFCSSGASKGESHSKTGTKYSRQRTALAVQFRQHKLVGP